MCKFSILPFPEPSKLSSSNEVITHFRCHSSSATFPTSAAVPLFNFGFCRLIVDADFTGNERKDNFFHFFILVYIATDIYLCAFEIKVKREKMGIIIATGTTFDGSIRAYQNIEVKEFTFAMSLAPVATLAYIFVPERILFTSFVYRDKGNNVQYWFEFLEMLIHLF